MKSILFLIVFCVAVVGGAYFLEEQKEEGREVLNIADLQIAQYSDRHITENAIVKDERFEQLTFVEPQEEGKALFGDQLAAVGRIFKSFFSFDFFSKPKNDTSSEYGSWVWTPIPDMKSEYIESILGGLQNEGVNVVYLSIDSYLDIYALPEGDEKKEKEQKFNEILEEFLVSVQNKGMAVDAEAGWRNWAEPGHTYKPLAIVNFVKDWNTTHQNKFRGFQYDIEPYLIDSYKASEEGKKEVLKNFIKLVDQTAEYLNLSGLKFSVVIPDFYDKKDKMTPVFSYGYRYDSVFGHLLRVLEKKEESSIIVMSYRNSAESRDGSIDVSKNEMKTAKRGRWSSNIILAQETGDVPPPYITFHNTSKTYFKEEVAKLRAAFHSNPNFGGIAVHYANAFLAIK